MLLRSYLNLISVIACSKTDKRNKKFSKHKAQFTRGQFVRLVQHTEED